MSMKYVAVVVACIFGSAICIATAVGAPATIFNLGTLGGDTSALAINTAGEVTGHSATTSGDNHAFRYTISTGVMADLHTLGGAFSVGASINNIGQIAGYSAATNGATHAFRLTENSFMADLGTLGGTYSAGYGINASGNVVGNSSTAANGPYHAFRFTGIPGSGGIMADLGTFGGTNSYALSINDDDVIAGY